MDTVTPDEALRRILALVRPLPVVDLPLQEALDHVLAEDVVATMSLPAYDNSAMDGYAVRSADLVGATLLKVVGEVRAGHVPEHAVTPGTAVRIMTGAPIPDGADAVVQYERTRVGGAAPTSDPLPREVPAAVEIDGPVRIGLNIRRAGEDLAVGTPLLSSGVVLGPSEIAVLASLGRARVRVVRRPVVGVLSTGDELVEPGGVLTPGKVFNSNGFALGALVERMGGRLVSGPAVVDSVEELQARLAELLETCDLVITSGGASGGAYDVVAQLAAGGTMLEPLAVAMKPGKPLAIGWLTPPNGAPPVPFLGLPGNPVAAMVAFELFARPAVRTLAGRVDVGPQVVDAVADEDFANSGNRIAFVRVRIVERDGVVHASAVGLQRSSAVSSLLAADGLAEVSGDGVPAGGRLRVRLVDWSGSRAALPRVSQPHQRDTCC